MKKVYIITLLFVSFFTVTSSFSQAPASFTFGGLHVKEESREEEISENQRKAIISLLQTNTAKLKIGKSLKSNALQENTSNFILPLRQAAGFSEPGFYAIGNYIDKDGTNAIKDYMCGQRTYNGHRGTDIGISPFAWKKMEDNAVEIISAANGVIIGKSDGIDDKSCGTCGDSNPNCFWNAVYVQNTDGTVCWYGHMKKGSVTSKSVGDIVVQGEYLGVVGSSGNSSGPHLHLEVYLDNSYTTLIDPWDGSCNMLGDKTYWQSQEPYYVPMVSKVMSASGVPTPYSCYDNGNGEKSLSKNHFTLGETVYLPFFLRDNIPGRTIKLKLTRPSGTFDEWFINSSNTFLSESWYYYYYNSSAINTAGVWKFSVEYGNNMVEHNFTVSSPLPVKLLNFSVNKIEARPRLVWQTTQEINAAEFVIQRSEDGKVFDNIASMPNKGNDQQAAVHAYQFDDLTPLNGQHYYRLKMVDLDGSHAYSKIISFAIESNRLFTIAPNPATKVVYIDSRNVSIVELLDKSGKTVLTKDDLKGKVAYPLDIEGIQKGLYILKTTDKSGMVQTKKLIVE